MADAIEHLKMVHTLCQREIEKLQKNVGEFIRNSNDMLEFISSDWSGIRNNDPMWLIACENFLSSIMSINELSRKFNLHLCLTDMSSKGSQFRTFLQLKSLEDISFHYPKKAITPPQPMEPTEKGVQFLNSDLCLFNQRKAITPQQPAEPAEQGVQFSNSDLSLVNQREAITPRQPIEPAESTEKEGVQFPNSDLSFFIQRESITPRQPIEPAEPTEKGVQFPNSDLSLFNQRKVKTHHQPMEPAEPAEKEGVQFPNTDLSPFAENTEFFASITCILNVEKLKFFILALQYFPEMAKLVKLQDKLEQMTRYTEVPTENEIFGIMVESVLCRAVRLVTPEQQHHKEANDSLTFPVLLLDYGDIIKASKSSAIYHIPHKYKEKPARAIECVLESINGDKGREDMGEVLQHYEYEKAKFTIVRNTGTMLYLNLVELTNRQEQLPTLRKTQNVAYIETNPFRLNLDYTECSSPELNDVDVSISIASTKEQPKMSNNSNISTNEETKMSISIASTKEEPKKSNNWNTSTKEETKMSYNSNTSPKESPKIFNNSITLTNKLERKILPEELSSNGNLSDISSTELTDFDGPRGSIDSRNSQFAVTKAELDILKEEPLCTSNAMKAVMGYVPTDDSRICKFYNSKTKSCFKGSNCRFEHSSILMDGWTKDVRAEIIDLPPKDVHFEVGSLITVVPTYIAGIDNFYAQAEIRGSVSNPYIWNPSDITENQKLHRPPNVFDLVLARYKDDHWYRAKVIEILDGAYKVFYVDYGNCETVTLNYLAKADKSIMQEPFQAFKCRLANIRDITKNNEDRDVAVNFLSLLILNHRILVQVLSHKDELILGIIDEHFYGVPNTLITKGYAKEIKTIL